MTSDEADQILDLIRTAIVADPDVAIGPVRKQANNGVEGIWLHVDGEVAYLGKTIAAAKRTADKSDWWIPERDGKLSNDDIEWFEKRAELGAEWELHELPTFKQERRQRLALNIGMATDPNVHHEPVELIIHRGAKEVGGSCVEIRCNGSRLILDIGLPLFDADREPLDSFRLRRATTEELIAEGIIPKVPGLFDDGPSPDAILLSHAHLDHTGLLDHSSPDIPVYASQGTSKMMLAGAVFAAQVELPRERYRQLKPGEPVEIGPFRVTGYPVDHSIYGCMAFLIEASFKTILYTGDIRLHGRKPGMMSSLVEAMKFASTDVMLMEGTHFGLADHTGSTEYELEEELRGHIAEAEGLVLMAFSPQHVDRLVGFIRAAKATGRTFVADVYTSFILHLLSGEMNVPTPERDGFVRMYVPKSLRSGRTRPGVAKLIDRFADSEITLDEIRANPDRYAMIFRPSMLDDFDHDIPEKSFCIYSSWIGYLDRPDWVRTRKRIQLTRGSTTIAHTTGHIRSADIAKFIMAIEPRTVVPIHTFEPERFLSEFANVKVLRDGECYIV